MLHDVGKPSYRCLARGHLMPSQEHPQSARSEAEGGGASKLWTPSGPRPHCSARVEKIPLFDLFNQQMAEIKRPET